MNLSAESKCFVEVGLILVLFSTGAQAVIAAAPAPVTAATSTAPSTSAPPSSASVSRAHHGDPQIQKKRLAFIKNAISFGLIAGIEDSNSTTRVLAGQKFIALPFEEKEDIVNVVWAYYKTKDPQKDVVLIIDQKSRKEIGEYSLANRGLKMK